MTVPATFISDDGRFVVGFDAQAWLDTLNQSQVLALEKCNFCRSEICDEAAYFYEDQNPQLKQAIEVLSKAVMMSGQGESSGSITGSQEAGFEVIIDASVAMAYLADHRH